MKKKCIIFLILFFSFLINATADTDWRVGTLVCDYKKGNESLTITYYNVSAARGDAEPYYTVTYNNGTEKFCMNGESMISKCPSDVQTWMEFSEIYNYNSIFKYGDVQFYSIKHRLTRTGYREQTNFDPKTLCSEAIIIDDLGNDGMIEVILCETNNTLEDENLSPACNYSSDKLFTLDGKTIGINDYAGSNKVDFTNSYIDNMSDIEKYCPKEGETYSSNENYDQEKCEQARKDSNLTVDNAEQNGQTEEELEKGYGEFKAQTNIEFNEASCNTLLGDTSVKGEPAYYLNFAFNLMKYAAIVLLLVLTIVEYAKAVASSNQDAIKKATTSTVKRLIIAMIIFLLPILINFVLRLLGIISTNGTCGIGI